MMGDTSSGLLAELKNRLEEVIKSCSADRIVKGDVAPEKPGKRTELAAEIVILGQKVQNLKAENKELRRVQDEGKKELLETLQEAHKQQMEEVTSVLGEIREMRSRSHAELLGVIRENGRK